MKYKIGDKVIDTRTNRSLTIRDILTNPTGYLRVFAQREYHWKDRLSFIEEKDGTRLYVGSDSLSAFYKDIHNWNRITEEEFKLISGKSCYSEINMIRRDLKINQILEEE